jgi:hypothetical protein
LSGGNELRCVREKLPNAALDPEGQRDNQERGEQQCQRNAIIAIGKCDR